MSDSFAGTIVRIDDTDYRLMPVAPAPAPAPEPARELGEVWQPKYGEEFFIIGADGVFCRIAWYGTDYNCQLRRIGNCYPTHDAAKAARRLRVVRERADRVAADLWKVRPAPPVGSPASVPYMNSDATHFEPTEDWGISSPWRFATDADCEAFISAMADDIATLLGGV